MTQDPVRTLRPLVTKVSEQARPTVGMTTVGEAVYLEVGSGGYSEIGQGRQQRRRSCRLIKRSLRWKAPWVRPQAVAFASDRMGRPFKGTPRSSDRGGLASWSSKGFERSRRRGWYPASCCLRTFSRAQATSASDRRCLGQLVWGKSTLAQEVDVGVAEA